MNINEEFEELKKEFKEINSNIQPLIQAKLELASQAMKEAIELSEKHGIPFTMVDYFGVRQDYIPESLKDGKFIPETANYSYDMKNFICGETGSYIGHNVNTGWYNSSSNC